MAVIMKPLVGYGTLSFIVHLDDTAWVGEPLVFGWLHHARRLDVFGRLLKAGFQSSPLPIVPIRQGKERCHWTGF
jgi:hypothetical protein